MCACNITGTLPSSWGEGTWPSLWTLSLPRTSLRGTLPPNWSKNSAFSTLNNLDLSGNRLNGSLPSEWGDDDDFDYLRIL